MFHKLCKSHIESLNKYEKLVGLKVYEMVTDVLESSSLDIDINEVEYDYIPGYRNSTEKLTIKVTTDFGDVVYYNTCKEDRDFAILEIASKQLDGVLWSISSKIFVTKDNYDKLISDDNTVSIYYVDKNKESDVICVNNKELTITNKDCKYTLTYDGVVVPGVLNEFCRFKEISRVLTISDLDISITDSTLKGKYAIIVGNKVRRDLKSIIESLPDNSIKNCESSADLINLIRRVSADAL